ncbi:hypothetical protein V7128_01615 [Neobacillus vireti]|uniref:hypothetical protein n=1 Tax=Neobacillus vireti TaxID=220686 RepID=UPI002FFECBBA
MGLKAGDKATVTLFDKKTGEVIATQEIQTSDIEWNREKREINVKMDIDLRNN